MNSKASAPRRSGRAKRFVKDWKRLERSGRYPMQELKDVMQLLIENRGPLPPEYPETPEGEEIVFVRTGTHSELFD